MVNPKRIALIAAVAAAVFVLDRLTTNFVVATIPLYESREVIGPYLNDKSEHLREVVRPLQEKEETVYVVAGSDPGVHNWIDTDGLSEGILTLRMAEFPEGGARPDLSAIGRVVKLDMQLGGAVGNLVDRIAQGYVVDFVDVGLPDGPRFWSFNVADSSIVVGIVLVTFFLWLSERRQPAPA